MTLVSFTRLIALSGLILVTACATEVVTPTGLTLMSESVYNSVIADYSDAIERYDGLYNIITMRGTILNSKVAHAQLDQNARHYMWDQTKYTEEKNKTDEGLKKELQVHLSFYTPDRKHDDLQKSKTLWKIFLDSEGRRYEGKAIKVKLLPAEIIGLYSYHDHFTTPYTLTFAVPAALVENKATKLTITGPVGSASLNFKGL
jgi:hypothetical protein